jgi:hypothetical protein
MTTLNWDVEDGARETVGRLRSEWAAMLGRYPWSHFVTLTVEEERSRDILERMVRAYLSRLESFMGKRWWWAYAVEGGNCVRPHVHLLLGGLDQEKRERVKAAWGRGLAEVALAPTRPNAAAYLVKALGLDYEHIDVSPGIDAQVRRWRQRERHRAQKRANEGKQASPRSPRGDGD